MIFVLYGKLKVTECIQRRRKLRDVSSVAILDRLEYLSENEWLVGCVEA